MLLSLDFMGFPHLVSVVLSLLFFKKNYLLYSVISAPYTGERACTLLQKKSTELPDPVEALTLIILQPYKNDYIKL